MYGHSKDYGKRSAGFGWLNPYFSRCPDGDTDMGHYWKESKTSVHEKAGGDQAIKFEEPEFKNGMD